MSGLGLDCGNEFYSKAVTFVCMLGWFAFQFEEFSAIYA